MDRAKLGRKLPRRMEMPSAPNVRSIIKYAFAGLSSRAGATTLAFAFAEYLSRKESGGGRNALLSPEEYGSAHTALARPVTVVEINDDEQGLCGRDYDKLGIDRRFAGREYVSCYGSLARGGSVRGIHNTDGGVNWLLRIPGESFGRLDIADYVRLSSGASGDFIILDVSGIFGGELSAMATAPDRDESIWDEDISPAGIYKDADFMRTYALRKLLRDCDRIFVVIDPLPSAMMAGAARLELFKALQSSGVDVRYIINKMNRGVDVREMKSFMKIRSAVEIPFLDPALIYAAEYNCCTAYAMSKLEKELEEPFARMSS